MKQFFIWGQVLIITILSLVACVEGNKDDIINKVTSVTLSATELSLTVGDTYTLTASVLPENAIYKALVWNSSDPSVATVSSSGEVKAIGAGTAVITVMAGDKSATCHVTVIPDAVEVTSVTLSATELSLTVGDTYTLTASVLPENATYNALVWNSSDPSVATVSSSGEVKAIGAGTAVITVMAGDKSATCHVTVIPDAVEVTSVTLSATELSLTVGDTYTLTASVLPENATYNALVWNSSDPSVATVSSSGEVKAIGAGTAVITVMAGDKSATCKIIVKQEGGGVDAGIDPWGNGESFEGVVN